MDMHEDLPQFAWSPIVATVTPFPMRRRVGKVRSVACILSKGTEKARHAYWTRTVCALEEQMRRAGIDSAAIDRELGAFRDAVTAELHRLQVRGIGGGGAA